MLEGDVYIIKGFRSKQDLVMSVKVFANTVEALCNEVFGQLNATLKAKVLQARKYYKTYSGNISTVDVYSFLNKSYDIYSFVEDSAEYKRIVTKVVKQRCDIKDFSDYFIQKYDVYKVLKQAEDIGDLVYSIDDARERGIDKFIYTDTRVDINKYGDCFIVVGLRTNSFTLDIINSYIQSISVEEE